MNLRLAPILLLFSTAACGIDAADQVPAKLGMKAEHAALIEEIEAVIRLPEDRFKLSDYSRHYAYDGDKVVAVYLAHGASDEGSIWLDNMDELPVVMDGGCSVVSFTYDPEKKKIESIGCNGEA